MESPRIRIDALGLERSFTSFFSDVNRVSLDNLGYLGCRIKIIGRAIIHSMNSPYHKLDEPLQ
jgi:hypothetical protein